MACACQPVNDVGEPCAGEPHARFDAAAGGNPQSVGYAARVGKPPADPTSRERRRWGAGRDAGGGRESRIPRKGGRAFLFPAEPA